MTREKLKKGLITLVLLAMLISMGTQGSVLAVTKLKLGTSFKGAPNYDLLGWAAEEKGFWKSQDLEVQWFPLRGDSAMHQAISAGSLDIGVGSAIGAMLAITGGVPGLIVANFPAPAGFYVYVLRDSPIRDIKELKGKSIATGRFGGAEHLYGQVAVEKLGMGKDVRFVAIGAATEKNAALKSRAVDAMMSGEQSVASLVVTRQIRAVAAMSDFLPRKWTENVVTVRTEVMEKQPEVLKRALKAISQAVNFVRANRDWAAAKLQSELGFVPEAARYISQQIYPETETEKIDSQALANVLGVLLEYGVIPKEKAPQVEKLYTTRFLD